MRRNTFLDIGRLGKLHQCCDFRVDLTVIFIFAALSLQAKINYNGDFGIEGLKLENVSVRDNLIYTRISLEGCDMEKREGYPEIPVKHIMLRVPAEAQDFAVEYETLASETIPLENTIYPVQPDFAIGSAQPDFMMPNVSGYMEASSFPLVEIANHHTIGENHIVDLIIRPVLYDYETKSLTLHKSISVSLDYTENGIRRSIEKRDSIVFRSKLDINSVVDNQNILETYGLDNAVPIESSDKTKWPTYIIVTAKSLSGYFTDFIRWKSQKGYNVILKTVEDIKSSTKYNPATHTDIVDDAAAVRKYLADVYSERKKYGDIFCLFAGDDTTSVPIRYTSSKSFTDNLVIASLEDLHPTDSYFCDLTTEWALKKTSTGIYYGKYGIAYSPDIYVGRLLCRSKTEIDNYTRKLMIYEAYPGLGNMDYLDKSLFFFQNGLEGGAEGKVAAFDFMKDIETVLAVDINGKVESLHPTGEEIIKKISKLGFSSWTGHGNPGVVEVSWINGHHWESQYISVFDSIIYEKQRRPSNGLDNLANHNFPSVAYSLSCSITPFDHFEGVPYRYNMGSGFTVAGNYGGVALLGNTRLGWLRQGTDIEKLFASTVKSNPCIGIASAVSKSTYGKGKLNYDNAIHNLIGDPEFDMWLHKPSTFSSNAVTLEGNTLIFRGSEIQNSRVTVYNNGITSAFTDTNPALVHSYPLGTSFTGGMIMVSVWKTGYLPLIRLYAGNYELVGGKEKLLTQEAYLGVPMQSGNGNCLVIGNNYTLELNALKSILTQGDVLVSKGGICVLSSEGSIDLSYVRVNDGGIVSASGNNVTLGCGFKIEKGGTISINK